MTKRIEGQSPQINFMSCKVGDKDLSLTIKPQIIVIHQNSESPGVDKTWTDYIQSLYLSGYENVWLVFQFSPPDACWIVMKKKCHNFAA